MTKHIIRSKIGMPKVSIIILNWNGKDLLKDCLMSLKKNTEYSNYKVIVVDNGSTDSSVKFLKREFPWVDVLALDRNYGFAEGNNRGIVYVLEKYNPDYILLLNNDTVIVQKNWLNRIVEVAESEEKIGIIGCKLTYIDGRTQYIGTKVCASGFFWLNPNTTDNLSEVFDVDAVLGACFLVKRCVINKIGLFDKGFSPFQHEETDYCMRAKKAGYRICIIPDVKIIHTLGATMKKVKPKYFTFINKKNEIRLILLNYPSYRIMLYTLFDICTLVKSCIYRQNWKVRMYLSAWLVNIKNLREIIKKRKSRTKKLWWNYEEN